MIMSPRQRTLHQNDVPWQSCTHKKIAKKISSDNTATQNCNIVLENNDDGKQHSANTPTPGAFPMRPTHAQAQLSTRTTEYGERKDEREVVVNDNEPHHHRVAQAQLVDHDRECILEQAIL